MNKVVEKGTRFKFLHPLLDLGIHLKKIVPNSTISPVYEEKISPLSDILTNWLHYYYNKLHQFILAPI